MGFIIYVFYKIYNFYKIYKIYKIYKFYRIYNGVRVFGLRQRVRARSRNIFTRAKYSRRVLRSRLEGIGEGAAL